MKRKSTLEEQFASGTIPEKNELKGYFAVKWVTGVFPETAISKFRQGEETGNIKKAAIQLANYYESDTVYRLKNFIEWVQIIIATCDRSAHG